jgi:hypothetical protein
VDSRELRTFLVVFLWWICGEMRGERGEKMTAILVAKNTTGSLLFLEQFFADGTWRSKAAYCFLD